MFTYVENATMIPTLLVCMVFLQFNVAQQLHENEYEPNKEDNIKKLFLRNVASHEDQDVNTPLSDYSEIPQPGGFKLYDVSHRIRRDANEEKIPEIDNSQTQAEPPATDEVTDNFQPKSNDTNVNVYDFVRFRRGTQRGSAVSEDVKDAIDFTNLRPFESNENQPRSGRMLLQDDNNVPEGFREPRGAIKEQWIKQPYPVRSLTVDDSNFDDSIASPSDVRAPRVHFVTQRRLESAPSAVFRNYEREGRSRDVYRDSDRDPPRSAPRVPPPHIDYYPPERPLKRFESYPITPFNPYRDEPFYRYEESRYDPRYGSLENERSRSEFPIRQRRIIYYATLPEVVRTPPNVNLRNRYIYRDRYDDRYVTSPSQSAEESSFRFRKPAPYTKPRFEQEIEKTKVPYPLKVSSDVNVRETKKNPERRIYSESDSRYAYKEQPQQSKENFDQRT